MRYPYPKDIMKVFEVGMDRPVSWHNSPEGKAINLGAGRKEIDGTIAIDYPRWKAGHPIPCGDEEVAEIFAFHFFEHLTKGEIMATLAECERILMPGGHLNCVTPHWSSEAAHQDLDHKSFWSESTWRNLLSNPYYGTTMRRDWRLKEVQSILMGVVQRNLVIVSQLVKLG